MTLDPLNSVCVKLGTFTLYCLQFSPSSHFLDGAEMELKRKEAKCSLF